MNLIDRIFKKSPPAPIVKPPYKPNCQPGWSWGGHGSFGQEFEVMAGVSPAHWCEYASCGCAVFIAYDMRELAKAEIIYPFEHDTARHSIVDGFDPERPWYEAIQPHDGSTIEKLKQDVADYLANVVPTLTYYWHVHHDVLMEPSTPEGIEHRTAWITKKKPENEIAVRLGRIAIVQDQEYARVVRQRINHDGIAELHAKECLDCPWDGKKLVFT